MIFCAMPAAPTTLCAPKSNRYCRASTALPLFLRTLPPLICYLLSRVRSREDESGRIESSANAARVVWVWSIWRSVPMTSTGNV